jgi:hypothetical protein
MHSLLTARNGNVQLSLVLLLNAQCSTHNLLVSYKINKYLATQKLTHSQDLGALFFQLFLTEYRKHEQKGLGHSQPMFLIPLYKLLYTHKIACIKVQLPSDMTPRSLQSWITRSAEAIMPLELMQFTTTTALDFKSFATRNHHLTPNTSKNTT